MRSSQNSITSDIIPRRLKTCSIPFFDRYVELVMRGYIVSERMSSQASHPIESPALQRHICDAIDLRFGESGAGRFGITPEVFQEYVARVVLRYGAEFSDAERIDLVRSLHVEELVLARACSAGIEAAWDEFVSRFRGGLNHAATQIAKDPATGRELADGLYAELYGLPNREGRLVSKLDYYMGRGSLAGWLRSVLAQKHVDLCRGSARDVSLDKQLEKGVTFAAAEVGGEAPDETVAEVVGRTLAELNSEERFLLATYYLDRQTLAAIGRQMGMHESTVSRKMDKLTGTIRKRIRSRLRAGGMHQRRCSEVMEELDVRKLNVDVAASLRQETKIGSFQQ
jgi:RNA polymerase sigma-70 factor (ECF subfamily)